MRTEFSDFADEVWPRLIRTAVLMGNSRQDAEDAAQTVLVACYRRWRKVGRMADRPSAYAFRALKHELGRIPGRLEKPVDPHDFVDVKDSWPTVDPIADSTSGAPVRNALLRLPDHHREVIVYAFYLDLPDAEIATALDIPLGTVKSRKARALGALEVLLNPAEI